MRIFLCWSGERSRQLALFFRGWLPKVIQALNPWMSEEDIEKGALWFTSITGHLKESSAGILFITPENLNSVWVHFEAGALSKTFAKEIYVCPYLLEVQRSQVEGPLAHFQTTQATKTDTRRLLGTLHEAIGEGKVAEKIVNETFESFWPSLEGELARIRAIATEKKAPARSSENILEEILTLVRIQPTRQELHEVQQKLQQALSPTLVSYSSPYEARVGKIGPTNLGTLVTGVDFRTLVPSWGSSDAFNALQKTFLAESTPPEKDAPPPASTGKESKRKPEK